MQAANVAPLRGRPLLAFRGAVIFLPLDLCFDVVEVGSANPPGTTTQPHNYSLFCSLDASRTPRLVASGNRLTRPRERLF